MYARVCSSCHDVHWLRGGQVSGQSVVELGRACLTLRGTSAGFDVDCIMLGVNGVGGVLAVIIKFEFIIGFLEVSCGWLRAAVRIAMRRSSSSGGAVEYMCIKSSLGVDRLSCGPWSIGAPSCSTTG